MLQVHALFAFKSIVCKSFNISKRQNPDATESCNKTMAVSRDTDAIGSRATLLYRK